ncbi:MAG: Gfo/Idh/MocA family oxidoreductase [Ilumatobacteraceae bacterium]
MAEQPRVGLLDVGFLGAGLIATYHSKSLRRCRAPVERVGVYDPDQGRAATSAEASGHTVMASEDEVLDSCQAVYNSAWTSEHLRQVDKAASRRLAVFCEKPLAFDSASPTQMLAMVRDAGVVNQVGLDCVVRPPTCGPSTSSTTPQPVW